MAVHQLTVAKCTEEELETMRDYLTSLEEVLNEHGDSDEDDNESNKAIANVARKLPSRMWIAMINLGILLDNYQDKESKILQHPKWIVKMMEVLSECNVYLNENKKNYIGNGSKLHQKIKDIFYK